MQKKSSDKGQLFGLKLGNRSLNVSRATLHRDRREAIRKIKQYCSQELFNLLNPKLEK